MIFFIPCDPIIILVGAPLPLTLTLTLPFLIRPKEHKDTGALAETELIAGSDRNVGVRGY